MLIRALLVALAVVCAAACSDSTTTTTSPSGPSASATIPSGASTMTTTAFGANPLTVTSGTTIMWVNNDNVTHTSVADAGAWNSGSIAPGGSFSRTFSSTGTFTYHCTIHPNMVGTIVVN